MKGTRMRTLGTSSLGNTTSGSATRSKQRFALVEWITGAYEGTFTENVNLEWVQGYDGESAFDDSYVIEWRQPPQPRSGWPIYDGKIHFVSDDLEFLRSKREVLEGKSTESLAVNSAENTANAVNFSSPEWKSLVEIAVQRALASSNHTETPKRPKPSPIISSEPEKVVVGKSLVLSKVSHTLALNAPSPGRMVGLLLRQTFSRGRLIRSSYAGQKRTKDGQIHKKPMLKRYQKMADIHAFVLQRFPHMSQAIFGATVNSFLGEKANKKRDMEYVQESESEDENENDTL